MHPISLQALKFDISYQKEKKKTDINQNTKNPTTVRSGHQTVRIPPEDGAQAHYSGFLSTSESSACSRKAPGHCQAARGRGCPGRERKPGFRGKKLGDAGERHLLHLAGDEA